MLHIQLQRSLPGFALNVSLDAPEEKVTVLFGPSGAGKSMTLSAIAGFIAPDAGDIRIGERTLFDSSLAVSLPPQQRHVGLVTQYLALFPHLTVEQNIAYGLFRQRPAEQRDDRYGDDRLRDWCCRECGGGDIRGFRNTERCDGWHIQCEQLYDHV